VGLNVKDIEAIIRDHLEDQPYAAVCEDCGSGLEVDATIDRDMDLQLKVTPCLVCLENLREELTKQQGGN